MTYNLLFSASILFLVNTHLLSVQLISSQDITSDITENIVAQEDTKNNTATTILHKRILDLVDALKCNNKDLALQLIRQNTIVPYKIAQFFKNKIEFIEHNGFYIAKEITGLDNIYYKYRFYYKYFKKFLTTINQFDTLCIASAYDQMDIVKKIVYDNNYDINTGAQSINTTPLEILYKYGNFFKNYVHLKKFGASLDSLINCFNEHYLHITQQAQSAFLHDTMQSDSEILLGLKQLAAFLLLNNIDLENPNTMNLKKFSHNFLTFSLKYPDEQNLSSNQELTFSSAVINFRKTITRQLTQKEAQSDTVFLHTKLYDRPLSPYLVTDILINKLTLITLLLCPSDKSTLEDLIKSSIKNKSLRYGFLKAIGKNPEEKLSIIQDIEKCFTSYTSNDLSRVRYFKRNNTLRKHGIVDELLYEDLPNYIFQEGITPLMLAAARGNKEFIKDLFILKNKAAQSKQKYGNKEPLNKQEKRKLKSRKIYCHTQRRKYNKHHTAYQNPDSLLKINYFNEFGDTALSIAHNNNHTDIAKLLYENMYNYRVLQKSILEKIFKEYMPEDINHKIAEFYYGAFPC